MTRTETRKIEVRCCYLIFASIEDICGSNGASFCTSYLGDTADLIFTSGAGALNHARMAGLGNNLVQVLSTLSDRHWEFLRLWTGFELPSSCINLPCYALNLNRNILDFMRWPQIGLGAQDLNDIQRPKYFSKNSWK
jgi:hypothetical protein